MVKAGDLLKEVTIKAVSTVTFKNFLIASFPELYDDKGKIMTLQE